MSGNSFVSSYDITLPLGQRYEIKQTALKLEVIHQLKGVLLEASLPIKDAKTSVLLRDSGAATQDYLFAIQAMFIALPDARLAAFEFLPDDLAATLYFVKTDVVDQSEWLMYRAVLWQIPDLWLPQPISLLPQVQVLDAQKRYHPLRPQQPAGEIYSRYNCGIDARVGLSVLDIEVHLDAFARWQNSDRVAAFWDQKGTLDEHRAYLQGLKNDPKSLPLIGTIDDEPFAYFEVYWAKEDRIAPYYDVSDYDRGIHMLVGEEHHRGPHKVDAWMTALTHFLFLDDPRTQKVVSEPRADNAKMISYLEKGGFKKEKEFDFPHKTSALMILTRDRFFQLCR